MKKLTVNVAVGWPEAGLLCVLRPLNSTDEISVGGFLWIQLLSPSVFLCHATRSTSKKLELD